MGAVVSPSDVRKNRKKVIEELTRDLDPASRKAITRVGFHFLELGVAQARRGWTAAEDIVNTRGAEELIRMRV